MRLLLTHLVSTYYCMSKKSLPLLYSKLYYNMDQDFLNNDHTLCRTNDRGY